MKSVTKKPLIGLDVSALDNNFKAHAGRGIGRYVRELHRYLDTHKSDIAEVDLFDHRSCQLPSAIERAISLLPAGRQTIRQQLLYPMQLKSGPMARFSTLHFPAHMDAPAWLAQPYILTVLDLIPIIFADLYAADVPGWRFRFARFLELRAIRSASMILAISDCTARDLERVLKIPPERIRVTPLGVEEGFFEAVSEDAVERAWEMVAIPRGADILLYVGGIDPRKNIPFFLRVFDELCKARQRDAKPMPHFVIAGRIEGDRNYGPLCAEIQRLGLQEQVHLIGYVPDEVLKALYQIATIFVFPSLYEGFGLPPLEAMAAGLPVVSSRAASLPEVLGDVGVGVDPDDSESWVLEIYALLENKERREELSYQGITQARRFSWTRTGRTTLNAYEEFCEGWNTKT